MRRDVLLTVLLVTLCGCIRDPGGWSTVPPTNVKKTNEVREKIGIRRIKKDWEFYGHEFSADKWSNAGGLLAKVVHYDDHLGESRRAKPISWEEDHYYSGKKFVPSDLDAGPVEEALYVYYDYRMKRFYLDYNGIDATIESLLDTRLHCQQAGGSELSGWVGTSEKETLDVADDVLKKWGLSRL